MGLGERLKRHGFSFKKQFGQNFISDGNLLRAIATDGGVTENDIVLEIGAGAGTLTAVLAEKAKKVIAFEIDENLKGVLTETLEASPNIQVLFADIMKVSNEEINRLTGGRYKVVANLPYYITTPIVMRFLEETDAESITVMVQKEVAERLTSPPGNKDYGAVTVAVTALSDAEITRIVSKEMFFPVPKVDSAVVRITANRNKYGDYSKIRDLVRKGFSSRRKTLANNLTGAGFDRERTQRALETMDKNKSARAEELSAEEFFKLAELLNGDRV